MPRHLKPPVATRWIVLPTGKCAHAVREIKPGLAHAAVARCGVTLLGWRRATALNPACPKCLRLPAPRQAKPLSV